MLNMTNDVYKILTEEEWRQGRASSKIITKLDLKDGFVHLSTASQLNASLSLYFANESRVVLAQINLSKIKIILNMKFQATLKIEMANFLIFMAFLIQI